MQFFTYGALLYYFLFIYPAFHRFDNGLLESEALSSELVHDAYLRMSAPASPRQDLRTPCLGHEIRCLEAGKEKKTTFSCTFLDDPKAIT